jgi:hypothetical protein
MCSNTAPGSEFEENRMKRLLALGALLVALTAALSACSASFSTANISTAVLAKDVQGDNYDPVDPTSTFSPDQPVINLVVTLKNAPSDTKVKAVWTAVAVSGAPANIEIDQAEIVMEGSSNVHFTLSRPSSGAWPVGRYKVDIYLDGKLDKTLGFTVVT